MRKTNSSEITFVGHGGHDLRQRSLGERPPPPSKVMKRLELLPLDHINELIVTVTPEKTSNRMQIIDDVPISVVSKEGSAEVLFS